MRISFFLWLGISISLIGGCASGRPGPIAVRCHGGGQGLFSGLKRLVPARTNCDCESCQWSAVVASCPENDESNADSVPVPATANPKTRIHDPAAGASTPPGGLPFESDQESGKKSSEESDAVGSASVGSNSIESTISQYYAGINQDPVDSISEPAVVPNVDLNSDLNSDLNFIIASLAAPRSGIVEPVSIPGSARNLGTTTQSGSAQDSVEENQPVGELKIPVSAIRDLPAVDFQDESPMAQVETGHRNDDGQTVDPPVASVADLRSLNTSELRPFGETPHLNSDAVVRLRKSIIAVPVIRDPKPPKPHVIEAARVGRRPIVYLQATTPIGKPIVRPSVARIQFGMPHEIVHGTHLLEQPVLNDPSGTARDHRSVVDQNEAHESIRRLTVRPSVDSKQR